MVISFVVAERAIGPKLLPDFRTVYKAYETIIGLLCSDTLSHLVYLAMSRTPTDFWLVQLQNGDVSPD